MKTDFVNMECNATHNASNTHEKFWQSLWIKVLYLAQEDEATLYFVIPSAITFVLHWMCSLSLLAVDMTGKPSFIYRYKIQENQKKITWRQLKMILPVVVLNQIITILMFFVFYLICEWKGSISHKSGLPSLLRALIEFSEFLVTEEILFYYGHRFLHLPEIYKRIHKMHHQWKAPYCITSFYCHWFEHIISTMLPGLFGPIMFGSHIFLSYVWFTVTCFSSLNAHCGYHFPFLPSSEAHDYHHLKFNVNFGVLGILDRLHNTDAKFRSSTQCKRHRTLFSFTPMNELIPGHKHRKTW